MKQIIYLILLNFVHVNMSFATVLKCPPVRLIKNVKLTTARQNPYDPECWDFSSNMFIYEHKQWILSFGTFLTHVTSQAEALKKGQRYFDHAKIINKHPHPIKIPSGLICLYTPNGMRYWISTFAGFR